MKNIILTCAFSTLLLGVFAQKKEQASSKQLQDKEAILAMQGCYKVTFEFAETFASDTNYQFKDRKYSWGIEYVFPLEVTDTKVQLQHILIVNDTFIVKHWRQDWLFENKEVYEFMSGSEWKKRILSENEAKGTWTQKVYQVDDSPRYESFGTWVHVDGRHFWQSTCDSPLPRREFTTRSDYNVLRRHSKYELTNYGWIYEQDNEKIVRENGKDSLIVWEKGFEKFTKGDYNCQPAIDWWEKNHRYWGDVRLVWDEVYKSKNNLKIQKKIDNKILFQKLFALGDEHAAKVKYDSKQAQTEIRKTITSYLQ
jgi:hypothetical protein